MGAITPVLPLVEGSIEASLAVDFPDGPISEWLRWSTQLHAEGIADTKVAAVFYGASCRLPCVITRGSLHDGP